MYLGTSNCEDFEMDRNELSEFERSPSNPLRDINIIQDEMSDVAAPTNGPGEPTPSSDFADETPWLHFVVDSEADGLLPPNGVMPHDILPDGPQLLIYAHGAAPPINPVLVADFAVGEADLTPGTLPTMAELFVLEEGPGCQENPFSGRFEIIRGRKIRVLLRTKPRVGDKVSVRLMFADPVKQGVAIRSCEVKKHQNVACHGCPFWLTLPQDSAGKVTVSEDEQGQFSFLLEELQDVSQLVLEVLCFSTDGPEGKEESGRKWKLRVEGEVDHHNVRQDIFLQSFAKLGKVDRLKNDPKARGKKRRSAETKMPSSAKRSAQEVEAAAAPDEEDDVAGRHLALKIHLATLESGRMPEDMQEREIPVLEFKIGQFG